MGGGTGRTPSPGTFNRLPNSQSMPLPPQPYYDSHHALNSGLTPLGEESHDPFQEDSLGTPLLLGNGNQNYDQQQQQTHRWEGQEDDAQGHQRIESHASFRNEASGGGNYDQSYSNPDNDMPRYGRIPQRQPRRYKTIKRVNLYHGNLVLDCQVPSKLLERCPRKEDREFTHMRFACPVDPVSVGRSLIMLNW